MAILISLFSVYVSFYVKSKNENTLKEYSDKLLEYEKLFISLKESFSDSISNNSKKYNEILYKCNSFEKILETFNNGFKGREGYY